MDNTECAWQNTYGKLTFSPFSEDELVLFPPVFSVNMLLSK